MPGQLISVPFISQVEDMDKYLLEYRSLKLLPHNTVNFHHQNRSQNRCIQTHLVSTNQRKKLNLAGQNNGQFRVQNPNKFSQSVTSQHGFKQQYHHLYHPGGNGNSVSLSHLPSSGQSFMNSTNSASSTPPPKLSSSGLTSSTNNSLGNEFNEYILPNDFNQSFIQSSNNFQFSQSTSLNNSNPTFSGPSFNNTGDFINRLPSALLSDSASIAENGSSSMFNSQTSSYPTSSTSSNFILGDSNTWNNTGHVTINNSNSSSSTNLTSGALGIWNNDMSVWS